MRRAFAALLLLAVSFRSHAAPANGARLLELTNLAQLRQVTEADAFTNHEIRLEGEILWANPPARKFVLLDASGAALLEVDFRGAVIRPSQNVRIAGNGAITRDGGGYRLGVCGAVVDDDGIHSMQEKAGALWLDAGRHPLRLEWFNGIADAGLEVEYSGPGLPRQRIPDSVLSHAQPGQTSVLARGLTFDCFELDGNQLPQTGAGSPLTNGVARNFDIAVRNRAEHVRLTFTGYIEVPTNGLYTFYTRSDDGSRLFIDAPSLRLEVLGESPMPEPRRLALGQVMDVESDWAQVVGTVDFASETAGGLELELQSGAGRIAVEVADGSGLRSADLLGRRIRATGVCLSVSTPDGQNIAGRLLVSNAQNIERLESEQSQLPQPTNGLPVLTSVAQVHALKREEAERGYPVSIRGVVTCVEADRQAVTIQDATRGFYVFDLSPRRSRLPAIGTYVEVKGTTGPGFFAPVVNATELTELGAGRLPEPVRPAWDQLINGSLDAQYAELQGIVTAVNTNGVTLLTREGRINVELRVPGLEYSELPRFENALVRLRGCLYANWDYVTHEVKAGEVRLYAATISADRPAPQDLFAAPKKSFGELLLFDPQAGAFERVKVAGQVLHAHDAECFLTDGKNGLRVAVTKQIALLAGDLVEVVGFSELSGTSPTLREAVVRKTGHAPLPAPVVLTKDDLLDSRYDATWVRAHGTLVSIRRTRSEELLEIQNGLRTFVARLAGNPELNDSLPPGCVLELTGVYSGLGGNKAVGQEITAFELLLNDPSGIKVLARPPWWTLERLLIAVGALLCVLAAALVWIKQLHRRVDDRTRQLEKQIRERERVEQQRALEQERSRVAQDLHDDLGAGLTEISVLGKQARSRLASEEQRAQFLDQMDDRARHMVNALDEIVWAMSPAQDTLESLVSYFCLHADRFLSAANIAWQLDNAADLPDAPINSLCRHELFLAFKEALTNVVRHSGATEVRLGIGLENGRLILTVMDNGRGIESDPQARYSDGLLNMRARMEKLNGGFEISSKPGRGTTLRFSVPATN